MIVDLAEQPSDQRIETDLCVIGGGAVGLAIAWYFRNRSSRDVVVLESGGTDFEPDIQDLYAGEQTGQRYNRLDLDRRRMLGGSTTWTLIGAAWLCASLRRRSCSRLARSWSYCCFSTS